MATSLILHEFPPSGNCYKIRLTAAHLGVPLQRRGYNILIGETRTPAFLSEVNANGRIPVLQIGHRFLPESNAAMMWLADGTDLVPEDRFDRADVLRWMFWEQYNHEPNIATLRFWRKFVGETGLPEEQRRQIAVKQAAGEAAMKLLDQHLSRHDFLAGDRFTVADIALYAYSHVAPEGGFDLNHWPSVQRWLAQIAAMPAHVTLDA